MEESKIKDLRNIWDDICQKCHGGLDCTLCPKTDGLDDVDKKAILVLHCLRRALRDGVRHYKLDGTLLTDPKDITQALLTDGSIMLKDP